MRYEVFWEERAKEYLKKIGDRELAEKIERQVERHLASDPTRHGKELKGNWEGRWRYKVDDYRAIYEIIEITYRIEGKKVIIAVVKVGKRTQTGDPDDVYGGEHPRSTLRGTRIINRPQARDHKRKVVGNRGKRKVGR